MDRMEHTKTTVPSMDAWIKEAKEDKSAPECGMYLFHNGIVRQSARAKVRQGDISASGPARACPQRSFRRGEGQ